MGAGALTLTGALSHSGATGVSEGTLAFATSQSLIGALNIADSAGLSVKAASSSSTLLTTTSLTLGSTGTTSLTFDFNHLNTTAAQISTGAFTANGNINFVFSNGGVLASGSHPLIDYTSFAGSGIIFNGAAVARWVFSNPASGTHTFSGSLAYDGTGALGFNKNGAGTQILSGDNSYTDLTTVAGGELIINGANIGAGTNVALSSGKLTLGHAAALGTSAIITMSGNNTATLAIATDGGDNLYSINQGTGTHSNIISDRAPPGVGINHMITTVGATPVGGGSITFTSGSNVTSGIGRIAFNSLNLGAGSVQTTLLNPTSANVSVGSVTKSLNNPAQTLELGRSMSSNMKVGEPMPTSPT